MLNLLSLNSPKMRTAIGLILVVFIIGYINSYFVIWLFLGSLLIISINETLKLIDFNNKQVFVYGIILWIGAYFYTQPEDLAFIVAIIYASKLAYTKKLDKKIFFPLFYPTIPFLFLFSLYKEFGIYSLLWLVIINITTDSAAYFIGKSIGKMKFCETSPRKTVEGVIGGVLLGSLIGSVFAISELTYLQGLIISFFIAIASIFGDLFESYLKREANVKDSGSFLPGHGGLLDRIDGYLFTSIVMLVILRGIV